MAYDIKQVIVIQKNLNMRKGKMCAQAAHASMKVFFDRMNFEEGQPMNVHRWDCAFTKEMLEWMNSSFAKIVVSVNSEAELLALRDQVEKAGIVHALILDNGNTEFKLECTKCHGGGINLESLNKAQTLYDEVDICKECNGTGRINKPTYTCLAIGPDKTEVIDVFTRELPLI